MNEQIKNVRNYNCKDEELPVMCRYVLFSAKRDKAEFEAFSPMFNGEYFTGFDDKIHTVSDIALPSIETSAMKQTTEQMHGKMDELLGYATRLSSYISLAGSEIGISAADFGINSLRRGIRAKDPESIIKSLKLINSNIEIHKVALERIGMTDEFGGFFYLSQTIISINNQRQYEILENRKATVQKNMLLFNELYAQMMEICKVGKMLFKNNAVKRSEYTFTELKSKVRKVPRY